jgi:exosortase
VALAGTKTTGPALTQPEAEEVLPGKKPPSPPFSEKLLAFWQTVKPFGWQGLLLVAVLGLLYWPVIKLLVWQWYYDPDYGHAFLVPLLSGFLIWQRRDKLRAIERRPSPWGMVIVLGALGLLVLGSLGAELTLARLSILVTICGLIVYFCGGAILRAIAFPMAFLLFAIPIPMVVYNEIVFPLQFVASRFATKVLETLNLFPIMREGNVLVLPGMHLEVVEACSGIRSLMSLLALAAGYGYLVERSIPVRCFLIIAMLPLAILSNGTRVMITALMANYIGPRAAEGFMHEFSGWVIFVVATILFLLLHSLITMIRKKLGWYQEEQPAAMAAKVGQ